MTPTPIRSGRWDILEKKEEKRGLGSDLSQMLREEFRQEVAYFLKP